MKPGLTTVTNRLPQVAHSIRELSRMRVMVGVPSTNASVGRKAGEPSNADLAYIHDNGDPASNIPARPFMRPGILNVRARLEQIMRSAGRAALDGNATAVLKWMHAAGLTAASSVKAVITAGIMPPLTASTVTGRIARRKSKSWKAKRRSEVAANVAAGLAPGAGLFTPLIDTGALRASITYVVREGVR